MNEQLVEFIIEMKEEESLNLVTELIEKGEDPLSILDACSKAMEVVGERFEGGEYFLPHLMMAGEILKQISAVVKPKLEQTQSSDMKGRVLMATVKGDVHDIGKDIVSFILEVNGFEVRDLGVDVPIEKFIDAIKEFKPQVVGMSGLLTLAYDTMKETVQAIREAGLDSNLKIMIGGGQMSEKIKNYTGADAYGEDAIAAVRIAKEWIGA